MADKQRLYLTFRREIIRGSKKLKNRRLLSPRGVVRLSCRGRILGAKSLVSRNGRCIRMTARQESAESAQNCLSSCWPIPSNMSSCMGSISRAKGSLKKGSAPASATSISSAAI